MSNDMDNIVLQHLRAIRADVGDVKNDMRDVKARLEQRLGGLPQEITAGVNVDAIAKTMGESLRQQLATTGLKERATVLSTAAKDIKAVSGQVSTSLQPVTRDYKGISAAISAELDKLTEASARLREHNAQLITRDHSSAWLWQGMAAVVLFLPGTLSGVLIEKRQTTDALLNMGTAIERMQSPSLTVSTVHNPKMH